MRGILLLAHFSTALLVVAHWHFPFKNARLRRNLLTHDQTAVACFMVGLTGLWLWHGWFDNTVDAGIAFAAGRYWALNHALQR